MCRKILWIAKIVGRSINPDHRRILCRSHPCPNQFIQHTQIVALGDLQGATAHGETLANGLQRRSQEKDEVWRAKESAKVRVESLAPVVFGACQVTLVMEEAR